MNCSTLRERAAGSPPNASQVSLRCTETENGGIFEMVRWCWFVLGSGKCLNRCPYTDALRKPLVREVCHCVTWFWQFDVVTPHCHSSDLMSVWAKAHVKIARMILTIKLDGNWSSFQLANNTPPLSVTGSVIAPSARMECPVNENGGVFYLVRWCWFVCAV